MKWLRLTEAKKYIKKTTDLNIDISRLRCWITLGLKNNSGRRSILRARKFSGQWHTTAEYIDEFIQEQSE